MPTCCKTFPSLLLSVSNIQGAAEDSSQYHKILLLDLQRTSSSQIVWRNNKNKTRKNKFFPISCEASCEDLFEFNYLKRAGWWGGADQLKWETGITLLPQCTAGQLGSYLTLNIGIFVSVNKLTRNYHFLLVPKRQISNILSGHYRVKISARFYSHSWSVTL